MSSVLYIKKNIRSKHRKKNIFFCEIRSPIAIQNNIYILYFSNSFYSHRSQQIIAFQRLRLFALPADISSYMYPSGVFTGYGKSLLDRSILKLYTYRITQLNFSLNRRNKKCILLFYHKSFLLTKIISY